MRRQQQSGFGLINLLVALLVFSLALIGLGVSYGRLTQAATRNEDIVQMAGWSNSLWGMVQANPNLMLALPPQGAPPLSVSSSDTVQAVADSKPLQSLRSNNPAAVPLVNLLADMLFDSSSASGNRTTNHALPLGSTVQLQLLADAGGAPCNASTFTISNGSASCTLQMTLQWPQTAPGVEGSPLRSQSFIYQFGF